MNLSFVKEIEVIWADMDPNLHMRHTSYSQYAAHARICFFNEQGYPLTKLTQIGIGAVLLREQTTYLREVQMHERLSINMELLKSTKDHSRYSIQQNILKENGKIAAKVVIDGTWIDMISRKVMAPSAEIVEAVIAKMPRAQNFEWVEADYYRF